MSTNAKYRFVTMVVTPTERDRIRDVAQSRGLTLSMFLRECVEGVLRRSGQADARRVTKRVNEEMTG